MGREAGRDRHRVARDHAEILERQRQPMLNMISISPIGTSVVLKKATASRLMKSPN